ncbi:MAG: hypothetical protein AAF358_19840 [Pseudomonadota bacterium]
MKPLLSRCSIVLCILVFENAFSSCVYVISEDAPNGHPVAGYDYVFVGTTTSEVSVFTNGDRIPDSKEYHFRVSKKWAPKRNIGATVRIRTRFPARRFVLFEEYLVFGRIMEGELRAGLGCSPTTTLAEAEDIIPVVERIYGSENR